MTDVVDPSAHRPEHVQIDQVKHKSANSQQQWANKTVARVGGASRSSNGYPLSLSWPRFAGPTTPMSSSYVFVRTFSNLETTTLVYIPTISIFFLLTPSQAKQTKNKKQLIFKFIYYTIFILFTNDCLVNLRLISRFKARTVDMIRMSMRIVVLHCKQSCFM